MKRKRYSVEQIIVAVNQHGSSGTGLFRPRESPTSEK